MTQPQIPGGSAAQPQTGQGQQVLAVPAVPRPITITKKPQLLRIMAHEFLSGGRFDLSPVRAYISNLSAEQVLLLESYVKVKGGDLSGKHRLVVFATLDSSVRKAMGADRCDAASTPVFSNARFAVFHCDGTQDQITLVCYTEEFLLNAGRPHLHAPSDPRPLIHKISAMNMSNIQGEGDVIWHRVSRPIGGNQGRAISGGGPSMAPNALHGMINTVGCWMLFRNYNWHRPRYGEFVEVYRKSRRGRSITADLQQLGYQDPENYDEDSPDITLPMRFFACERNYAYTWFTRDVVGIDYFSYDPWVNGSNMAGEDCPPVFPRDVFPQDVFGPPGKDNAHDWGARHQSEPKFRLDSSLWTANACGFQTAEDFAPFAGKDVLRLEQTSWADAYFYRA